MQEQDNENLVFPEWEKAKEAALKLVAEAGGEVVKIFDLTEGTPITVIHSKFKEPKTDGFEVFLEGRLLCAAVNWEAATIIGSALGYTGMSLVKNDSENADHIPGAKKAREW